MSLIPLPCYEGFDAIAIWPEDESVSNLVMFLHSKFKYQFELQMTSYYGLLSTKEIKSPKLTPAKVTVPFYTGCRYAAYPARNVDEVILIHILVLSSLKIISQAGTYSFFSERPVMLIYHEKCHHVMDIKVGRY